MRKFLVKYATVQIGQQRSLPQTDSKDLRRGGGGGGGGGKRGGGGGAGGGGGGRHSVKVGTPCQTTTLVFWPSSPISFL